MTLHRPTSAFTLIELMLSIGLGSLILYTAFAGVRTASQAITVSNQLSLENAMLRAGYFQVQNDLDFWTSLDDPNNPSNQKLRGYPNTGPTNSPSGMPFTPMSLICNGANQENPPSAIKAGSPLTYGEIKPRPGPYPSAKDTDPLDPWEKDTGFDPTVSWTPSDPRTWCQVNPAEKSSGSGWGGVTPSIPSVLFGRYAIFSNVSATPALNSWTVTNPTTSTSYSVGYSPPMVIPHLWYPNQIQFFLGALGYQAMCEYLPPNALYAYYMGASGSTSAGGLSLLATMPQWGSWGGFRNSDGGQVTACGIYRETYSTSFGYLNPWAPADPTGEPGIFWRHYMHFDSDYTAFNGGSGVQWGAVGLQDLLAHTAFPQNLLPLEPTNWPGVYTTVGRLVKCDHFVAVAKINRRSSITGSVTQISFLGLGTTLRGARMQRKDPNDTSGGSGWAHWDDDPAAMTTTPGPNPGQGNQPNLDSPTP